MAWMPKPKITFVLGGPGAGKGTQCEMLAAEYGLVHLSAGELLRKEQATGSENGQLIDRYLSEGRIVPVEVSLTLLRREIQSLGQARYLIDGFPRNHDNLQGWMKLMQPVCDIENIIFIECSEEEQARRILSRGQTSQRSDDNLSVIQKRFVTFHEETMPVVRHFDENRSTFPFCSLPGQQSKEVVHQRVQAVFQAALLVELQQLHAYLLQCYKSNSSVDCKRVCLDECQCDDEQRVLATAMQISPAEVAITGTTAVQHYYVTTEVGSSVVRVERRWVLRHGGWKLASVRAAKTAIAT